MERSAHDPTGPHLMLYPFFAFHRCRICKSMPSSILIQVARNELEVRELETRALHTGEVTAFGDHASIALRLVELLQALRYRCEKSENRGRNMNTGVLCGRYATIRGEERRGQVL